MITKSNKIKNNKTRKHRFNENNIPNNLKEASSNIYNEENREKNLACYLANNDKVINFASELVYFLLLYWKKNYSKKWKLIIGDELLQDIEGNIVNKIGFSVDERSEIYKFMDNNNKVDLIKFLKDKFFKTTSTLNNLSKPDYTYFHVNINKKLQKQFIFNLKKLFLIKDITWHKFSKIYNNVPGKFKKSYNFFIFDIIIYGNNDVKNLSLYKKNLTYLDFIKKSLYPDMKNNPENLVKFNNCNKSSISGSNFEDYQIFNTKNIYDIDKYSPYAEIMMSYGEPYLGGPSGSAAILFISIFKFYQFPQTTKHKIYLLCLIIADYIPLWHTLPEILLSTNVEMKSHNIPSYNIDKEPVHYVYNIIKNYI
jgi:hypothetical protein